MTVSGILSKSTQVVDNRTPEAISLNFAIFILTFTLEASSMLLHVSRVGCFVKVFPLDVLTHHPEQVPHELPQDSRTISTLVRPSFLTESYAVDVVAANEHMHKHRIMYWNLKPETVLSNAKLSQELEMETDVINIDGITDSDTVDDFGYKPSDGYHYNYMKIETGVNTVVGNTDSETMHDFGCEPSDGY